jgi:uncharacterized lipoprotein YmbA
MKRAVIAMLAGFLLTACGTSPQLHWYALEAAASPGNARAAGVSVYIGAVTVPEAVDRPQLVLRKTGGEIAVLDAHRWVEPLKVAIGRVVAAQLGDALGSARVGAFPGTALADATYRVQLDVQRFDSVPGGAATIEAIWSVRRAAGGAARTGRSSGSAPAAGDTQALPRAHVVALEAVSRDLASAIRELEAAPK